MASRMRIPAPSALAGSPVLAELVELTVSAALAELTWAWALAVEPASAAELAAKEPFPAVPVVTAAASVLAPADRPGTTAAKAIATARAIAPVGGLLVVAVGRSAWARMDLPCSPG
ncbi:MAG: hypothetical protein QXD59_08295 [Candidatus Caldarchaeum sp.]